MRTESTINDVFVVCRFDSQFTPLFKATVFAILDCGFRVRCALEEYGTRGTRIDKIMKLISSCPYCIADISLGDVPRPDSPRLNMAMELGAFYAIMLHGKKRIPPKSLLVMDKDKDGHQKTISNLNGIDIHPHGNDPEKLIKGVRDWLFSLKLENHCVPTSQTIVMRFATFLSDLPKVMGELGYDPNETFQTEDFNDFVEVAAAWLRENDRMNRVTRK